MLSEDEELRLAACIDATRADLESGSSFYINPETAMWLAEKLKELNNELKLLQKPVADIPNNPLTLEGRVIALWEDSVYKCIFCPTISGKPDRAFIHGRWHFKQQEENNGTS